MTWADVPNSPAWRNASSVILDLPEWLRRERTGGSSYHFMAAQLNRLGAMVTHETVRAWCSRLDIPSPAAGPSRTAVGVPSGASSPRNPVVGEAL